MIFKKVPLITDPTRQIQEWQFQYLNSDTIASYQILSNSSSYHSTLYSSSYWQCKRIIHNLNKYANKQTNKNIQQTYSGLLWLVTA